MDDVQTPSFISESIKYILLFGLMAFATFFFAKSRGFFKLTPPLNISSSKQSLRIGQVLVSFGIYLGISSILAPIIAKIVRFIYQSLLGGTPDISIMSVIQLIIICMTMYCLYYYNRSSNADLLKRIFKDDSVVERSSVAVDFVTGAMTWLIGFPFSAVVGQIADVVIYFFYGMPQYEQVAVKYLKMTLGHPLLLSVALFTIIIAAPLMEEFLFRGLLQTWIKNKLGTKPAILLASLCFALFHVSASQGIGNITLVFSLFSFALFLGFIYEKKGSLFASIGLHMTFNTISTFRILFFTES